MTDDRKFDEERIMVGETGDLYPCDLCDRVNTPHVSWHCTHDDPAHVTTVCLDCLESITSAARVSAAIQKKFNDNRTDPYQETF